MLQGVHLNLGVQATSDQERIPVANKSPQFWNAAVGRLKLPLGGFDGPWPSHCVHAILAAARVGCRQFNNRENPYLFRDTLTRLLAADTLPYKTLTA